MDVSTEIHNGVAIASLSGRLDGFGSQQLDSHFQSATANDEIGTLVVDLRAVSYISSAGIRSLLTIDKALRARNGKFAIAGLSNYCRDVIEMAGFAEVWTLYKTPTDALNDLNIDFKKEDRWAQAAKFETESGAFKLLKQDDSKGTALVLGDIANVLASKVSPDHISSKLFSQTEYSIGLGGLGERLDDYLPIMGEMITIGGTMVWLPTDGHDTADYLIPKQDTGSVRIRTGFNVALAGGFNDLAWFESNEPNGTTISQLYQELFKIARNRRPDFKGGIGLALRAQMSTVYGSGVLRSPIAPNRPSNGQWITHPDNFSEWFEIDKEPRHREVTGLIAGIGVDLSSGSKYTEYDPKLFGASFYVNPANAKEDDLVLHNHGVLFSPMDFSTPPQDLAQEVNDVVEKGEFIDMRHLLDGCQIRSALVGINYIHEFVEDPGGDSGHI
jgi:anti-anti-sigma factor